VKAEVGDKVRLKSGAHAGSRGVLEATEDGAFLVRLEESGQVVRVLSEAVTNFSLAARKAWVTEPNRGVGRRKGTKLSDRVSVIFRIDRELWERFREMEAAGIIDDRTAAINGWLREKLDELDGEERRGGCPRK
jgi:hypothetical protein